ncbi:hypothetical protein SAMN04487783_0139 [Agrococcus baldri]|uniref:Uncharacterized protein n=1 Tax=Agrococcus baldri TaxID=153730 RepID=A0AA94HJW8_9MICO|nr:hypothetical protein SAMN04487783_0139 [Agrococcus baldri]
MTTQTLNVRFRPQSLTLAAIVIAAFVVGFVVSFAPAAAHAGVSTGGTGAFSWSGSYRNNATVATYPSTHQANAFTDTWPNGHTAPAGWVGSRGRLFNASTGALRCEGSNQYNPSALPSGSHQVGVSCVIYQAGTWYSYGVSRAYNGSSWTNRYTFASGNQNS